MSSEQSLFIFTEELIATLLSNKRQNCRTNKGDQYQSKSQQNIFSTRKDALVWLAR